MLDRAIKTQSAFGLDAEAQIEPEFCSVVGMADVVHAPTGKERNMTGIEQRPLLKGYRSKLLYRISDIFLQQYKRSCDYNVI